MPPDPPPSWPTNSWGPYAEDPWSEPVPDPPEWHQAVREAWFRGGGTEAGYRRVILGEGLEAEIEAAKRSCAARR